MGGKQFSNPKHLSMALYPLPIFLNTSSIDIKEFSSWSIRFVYMVTTICNEREVTTGTRACN